MRAEGGELCQSTFTMNHVMIVHRVGQKRRTVVPAPIRQFLMRVEWFPLLFLHRLRIPPLVLLWWLRWLVDLLTVESDWNQWEQSVVL